MDALKNYFLCNHRMNRKPFILIALLVFLIAAPIDFYLSKDAINPETRQTMADLIQQKKDGKITPVQYKEQMQSLSEKVAAQMPIGTIFVIALIANLVLLPTSIMRFKDLSWSPWLAAFNPAAAIIGYTHIAQAITISLNLVAVVLALILLFKRGTVGPNRYGADPLQSPTAG